MKILTCDFLQQIFLLVLAQLSFPDQLVTMALSFPYFLLGMIQTYPTAFQLVFEPKFSERSRFSLCKYWKQSILFYAQKTAVYIAYLLFDTTKNKNFSTITYAHENNLRVVSNNTMYLSDNQRQIAVYSNYYIKTSDFL